MHGTSCFLEDVEDKKDCNQQFEYCRINGTHEENMQELRNDAKAFGILCGLNTALMLLSGIIYVDLFNHVALNIIIRLRCKYFEATLRQDISWHDIAENQNFALTITE